MHTKIFLGTVRKRILCRYLDDILREKTPFKHTINIIYDKILDDSDKYIKLNISELEILYFYKNKIVNTNIYIKIVKKYEKIK